MKSYKKFMTEQKGDTAVFTFGRFNPPTVGHEKLITAVETVAKNKGGDYFIYGSMSQDAKKNPLEHTKKMSYLKKMFPKHRNSIISNTKAKTAIDSAVELYGKGYTNLIMVVGSDRIDDFKKLLTTYNGVEAKHGFYDYDKIEVVSAGERDPDADGVEGMSASKMREAAVKGDFQTFRMGTPKSLSDNETKKLFNDIRKGLRLDVVREGTKWKNITFELQEQLEVFKLPKDSELSFGNYTTGYLHTSPEAYNFFEEIINSMGTFSKKGEFYLKESLSTMNEFLELREEWSKEKAINSQDLFYMESLAKKYIKFTENLNVDHLDSSFIYKYLSEIRETLEWGDTKSLRKYVEDTPHMTETAQDTQDRVAKWLSEELGISFDKSTDIVKRAMTLGIDPVTIQQKWSLLEPSITKMIKGV